MLTFTPPIIRHIDDVLPHIVDKPEIVVGFRDDYTMIDYVFAARDTFDNLYARECRGLKFDLGGRIIARPYHKFHNINENEAYLEQNIDLSRPHVLLDKLDGSMLHTLVLHDKVRLMTRKGFSEVALRAEAYLERNSFAFAPLFTMPDYPLTEWTFIFEYVAPTNQIVIFYETERLILTAIRNITTGQYVPFDQLRTIAAECWVPVVDPYSYGGDGFSIEAVKADLEKEGLVIRFDEGSMVKVKADDYCRRHGAVDSVSHAHGVLELAFANILDDVLPNLSGEFKDRVIDYRDRFFTALDVTKAAIVKEAEEHDYLDQKAFAAQVMAHPWRAHLFAYRKTRDINKVVDGYIARTSFKGKKVQEVCEELGLPYEQDLGRW